jgi:hypothetical protein
MNKSKGVGIMGAAIAQYRSMPEEELRRECIRLARLAARLEKEKAEAIARASCFGVAPF